MITRPLDLSARLRREPRSFDWLFYVNGGLIVLFFSLFGSRFVLAPGFAALPAIAGADTNARQATHYITVYSERQIFAGDGLRNLAQLGDWLAVQARREKEPVLLVQSDHGVDLDLIARITSAAYACGFKNVHIAAVEPRRASAKQK